MEHATHTRLQPQELTEATLNGATVYGPDDSRIGHVSKVLDNGVNASVIVDVGGFLGLGAKPVAMPVRELDFMRDASNSVHAVTRWTKDELKNMPEYQG